ncbi:RimJ/RimL family protein N-acetyltransferase [Spinactinospora alkalitolerans]|uniref:RimJ/RimL family protein N-acetyltransferase n=1 Tax=Spinactinospora alkalitolerans TaxID=687207 RepID=A0A852TLR5_9ACTN|nr:GNAT family N-acetyltransferase [Spinactinospora alkalitolerans]NYE44899.1 RimJ/RimL family protein N-acetyltransferase [Spinactinospora alkalitolerans]
MGMRHWPLYDLKVATPRLELRLPQPEELDALAELAAEGVHDPEVMPFIVPWTDAPPEERARAVMQYHWRRLAEWTPQDWTLPLTVFLDGRVVGTQDLAARDFAVVREVSTGSWLGRSFQRRGIGTEMRAGALHLAFAGLGAESARSAAMSDNAASLEVSRRLGYRRDGAERIAVRGRPVREQRLLMERADWLRHRTGGIEVTGLGPGPALFGLDEGGGTVSAEAGGAPPEGFRV